MKCGTTSAPVSAVCKSCGLLMEEIVEPDGIAWACIECDFWEAVFAPADE